MEKLIKVTPDLELSVVEWPVGGQIEHVRPARMYELLHKWNLSCNYCMLVDEEGLLKDIPYNPFGSYLYKPDQHGSPIVGTVLIVQEIYEDFAPIAEKDFTKIFQMMKLTVD